MNKLLLILAISFTGHFANASNFGKFFCVGDSCAQADVTVTATRADVAAAARSMQRGQMSSAALLGSVSKTVYKGAQGLREVRVGGSMISKYAANTYVKKTAAQRLAEAKAAQYARYLRTLGLWGAGISGALLALYPRSMGDGSCGPNFSGC